MARFTAEQKKISEAMKRLIDLYYQYLETGQSDWFSPPSIQKVAGLIDLVIPNFKPSLYFQHNSHFRYGTKEHDIGYRKEHIEALIEIMTVLKSKIDQGVVHWFEIKGRTVTSRQDFESEDSGSHNKSPHLLKKPTVSRQLCRIIQLSPKSDDEKEVDEYFRLLSAELNAAHDFLESFHVKDHFAYDDPGIFILEHGDTISSPGYVEPSSGFIHVVKYLLVKYQYLFGSFDRVKTCRHCGKMFIEKKLGSGTYCSGTCRKRHFDALQPQEKRLCRERQNAWIRYRQLFHDWPKAFTLQRDDCLDCPGTVESGKCEVLVRKNSRVFKNFDISNPMKK